MPSHTLEEQVKSDVAKGLYSAEEGRAILAFVAPALPSGAEDFEAGPGTFTPAVTQALAQPASPSLVGPTPTVTVQNELRGTQPRPQGFATRSSLDTPEGIIRQLTDPNRQVGSLTQQQAHEFLLSQYFNGDADATTAYINAALAGRTKEASQILQRAGFTGSGKSVDRSTDDRAPVGEFVSTTKADSQLSDEAKLKLIDDSVAVGNLTLDQAIKAYLAAGIKDRTTAVVRFNGLFGDISPDSSRDSSALLDSGKDEISSKITVPIPEIFPAPDDPSVRGGLFEEESAVDFRRRIFAEKFGSRLTPTAGRVADAAFNRFGAVEPLLRFQDQGAIPRGERFNTFFDAPNFDIAGGIDQLLGSEALGTGDVFIDDDTAFRDVARLGLQESLAGVNAPLRRRIESRILDEFATERAQQPENFQNVTQANLADLLRRFRGRGFGSR